MMKRTSCTIALAIAVLVAVPSVQAAISYGNLNGDTVLYQDIQEDSSTDPGVALYGAPSISGDSLLFSPVSFGISVMNTGMDIMDGTLAATLQTITGYGIHDVILNERGDYTLAGSGTANTWAAVAASLFVRVTKIDGHTQDPPLTKTAYLVFTPSDGTYNLVEDPGMNIIWQGGGSIDVDQMILDAGLTGTATRIDISMDNQLMAFSETGTIAYIKKKQIEEIPAISITPVIPEPATLSLLALGGLLLRRRS